MFKVYWFGMPFVYQLVMRMISVMKHSEVTHRFREVRNASLSNIRIRMKTIISFLVVFYSNLFTCLLAQNGDRNRDSETCGIYMNSSDFRNSKISLAFNCKSSGKIKLHDFFAGKYVDVITNGTKTRLNKDSIYGYHTCKNEDYRFYKSHDEEFRILENKGIVIYKSFVNVSSPDKKFSHLALTYFFSKTTNSDILPLTILNLKRAYPDNIKFHDMLDREFAGGEPLSAYSSSDKMYKVNYLFSHSINPSIKQIP